MKILHIINSLEMGGAEKLIADSLPLYQKMGIEVELLVLKHSKTILFDELAQSKIKIHALSATSVYAPQHIFKIIPYLKAYDLIHVHLFPAQYWTSFAKLLSFSKTPLIFTEHNTSNRRWGNKLFYLFDRMSYGQFKKVGCITEQVKQEFDRHMPSMASKSVVIHNGINVGKYVNAEAYAKYNISDELLETDRLLIQVSAFRAQKDQDTLIKALLDLPSQYKLLLVGAGERLEYCKALVKELQLSNRVFFLGDRADVPQLLKTAWIAIQSSHWEGFGLAAVEAMAAGIPVIASKVSGLAEVIGRDELLFEKGNASALAELILSYGNDPESYRLMAHYCRDSAKKYDIVQMAERYHTLYKEMIVA